MPSLPSPEPTLAEQKAVLLEKENARLLKLITKLSDENATLRGDAGNEQIQLEIARLKGNLDRAMKRLYGDSSERLPIPVQEKPPAKPQRGHGPRPQPKLPIEQVVIELPADERACPTCSGELAEMKGQYEESEQVSVIETVYFIKQVLRKKYRCSCQAAVVTAAVPTTHLPGGRYSLELAASIAVDKYRDHIPLNRQASRMARQGFDVSTQTLWDQLDALGCLLAPVHDALRERVCSSSLVHADETPWRLMGQTKGKRKYAWSICDGDSIYFDFLRGRSEKDAAIVLKGFRGDLVCDGYVVYENLARGDPHIQLVGCWAHVRRKFKDAESGFAKESHEALLQIAQLYSLEHMRPLLVGLEDGELEEARDLDGQIRGYLQRIVVNDLRNWAETVRASKESSLGSAVRYMLGRWVELTRFLDNSDLPLDNNLAERTIRGPVVGRKVHYGSRSLDGCRVAGCMYSLLETCKLHDVDPRAYLIAAVKAAVEDGTVLLPQDLA